jgi:hypothetical protein
MIKAVAGVLFFLIVMVALVGLGGAVLSFGSLLLSGVVTSFEIPALGFVESVWIYTALVVVRLFLTDWRGKA